MDSLAPITLSQLQTAIGNAIRMNRATQGVWVTAEFSDLRVVGGHCYMELLEKDAAGTTRAKIRAMIWSGTLGRLRRKFFDATGRDIASGMKVMVYGSASHHVVHGLSFSISDIDPSYTLGDMERIRREILEQLRREGVIDANRSLEVPVAPQRIAVISAAGAAGYGDFMNQIATNPDGFAIYPFLFPAVMQGERTASSVIDALAEIEMTIDLWDLVVIIRGGGATTDLNGFDNLDLARRVATFPLPIAVGIGHERDRTVLDDIAAIRCKTPTAVAAYIIDSLRLSYTRVRDLVRGIAKFGADAMRGENLRLSNLSQSIPALAETKLIRAKASLASAAQNIDRVAHSRIARAQNLLDRIQIRIPAAASNCSEKQRMRIDRLADLLRVLNPDNTLRRGYSITRINGHAVRNADDVPRGAIVETTLHHGKISSKTIS